MKRISLFVLIFVLLFTSVVSASGYTFIPNILDPSIVPPIREMDAPFQLNFNLATGEFQSITFQVSSTGASSTTTYRTEQFAVFYGDRLISVDLTDMHNTKPPAGVRWVSQITLTKDEIFRYFRDVGFPELATMNAEQLNNADNWGVGAQISILRNGSVVETTRILPEEMFDVPRRDAILSALAGRHGFGRNHIDDWHTRFSEYSFPSAFDYEIEAPSPQVRVPAGSTVTIPLRISLVEPSGDAASGKQTTIRVYNASNCSLLTSRNITLNAGQTRVENVQVPNVPPTGATLFASVNANLGAPGCVPLESSAPIANEPVLDNNVTSVTVSFVANTATECSLSGDMQDYEIQTKVPIYDEDDEGNRVIVDWVCVSSYRNSTRADFEILLAADILRSNNWSADIHVQNQASPFNVRSTTYVFNSNATPT